MWLLIAFTAWVWIQNAWAIDPAMQLDLSILLTKYLVLFYLIYRLVDSPREMNNVLFLHVLGCFYLGWLAYSASDAGRLDGVGGPGIGEANALAMHVSTGVMAAAVLIMNPGRWWMRLACLLAMPFMLNVIVQAESRSAGARLRGRRPRVVVSQADGLSQAVLRRRGGRRASGRVSRTRELSGNACPRSRRLRRSTPRRRRTRAPGRAVR